jgi:cell division inhibitor SepF
MAGLISQVSGWLGFGDEAEAAPQRPTAVSQDRGASRVTALRPRRGGEPNEIFTIEPKSYKDAGEVAMYFREGVSVIVNMHKMTETEGKRMLDFMLGLQHGLQGHLQRVTQTVFLLAPAHVQINDEEPIDEVADDLLVRP